MCIRDRKNIITVEDPVERRLAGITQVQVGSTSRSPLVFSQALRSVLRQDPDIIMIGEIRDHDTALIATESALTGHLVLSTLHTNDSCGAPPRLLDMGIEPFLVSSSVTGVLAQRLVRVLCPKCKEPYELAPEALERLNIPVGEVTGKITAYKARGCSACSGGYKGRIGAFELLTVTDEVELAEPQAFGTALVTFGKWKPLDGETLVVWDGKEAVRVALAATGGELAVQGEKIREDVRTRSLPTRIGLDFKQPVAKAAITLTVTPTGLPAK